MAEIKWIKITTDIFDDEKIRIIEKMPEGDTMLVIWLKLLTLAGKKNDSGMIYFTKEIPYTPEILSDIFNRESRLISLALNTFVSFGMIEIENNIINVLNWDKHQNIEGMDKIREQNRIRQDKYRHSRQLKISNVTSRDSNGTEEDKEEDKDKIKTNKKSSRFAPDFSFIDDLEMSSVFQMWCKGKSKKYSNQIQLESGYKKLSKLSDNDTKIATEIVENSLANNWSGLFELKSNKQSSFKADKPISNFDRGRLIIEE